MGNKHSDTSSTLTRGVVDSYADACRIITTHNKDDERHSLLEKYTSHFI